MQGWRKRMEDAHIHQLNIGGQNVDVYGVFDGHGGKEVSQFVKTHFVEELAKNQKFKESDYKSALKETFLKMDELMRTAEGKKELIENNKKSKQEDDEQKMKTGKTQPSNEDLILSLMMNKISEDDPGKLIGCTSCVCLVDNVNKVMYFANAGDSRVVLCKKGVAYPKSIDHKPELDIEKNRITKAGGFIQNGRVKGNLNLSRCLGDFEYKGNFGLSPEEQMITADPDIITEDLTNDCDFIIIGCDGIWDCLTNQQACDFVNKRLTDKVKLSSIVEEMMDSIIAVDINNEKGVGCDNMTCMIIQFIHK